MSEALHPNPESAAATTSFNRAVLLQFAQLMYEQRDPAAAFERFVSPEYIQHNPMLPDGREAALAFLVPLYTAPESRFEVQRIIVEGELAAVHLRAHPSGRPVLAVIDIYRLAGGLIMEHWDAIQPMPEHAANDHPMF